MNVRVRGPARQPGWRDADAQEVRRPAGPLLEGRPQGRAYARSEWKLGPSRCGVALDLRAVRTRNAKLTLELGSGAGELYLLDEDPGEMHNRFDDRSSRRWCAPGRRTNAIPCPRR